MPEEAVAYDDGNDRLREAHLHNGQAKVSALFASYLALSGVAAALLVGWALQTVQCTLTALGSA